MISSLTLRGVGPASEMSLAFGERLNIITGDNGLGKSFLLDVIWWVITRGWPAELNLHTIAGRKARPNPGQEGTITAEWYDDFLQQTITRNAVFDRVTEKWEYTEVAMARDGLVLYAMVDGSFAVWDYARNMSADDMWRAESISRSSYVFTQNEIWNGQKHQWTTVCKGFIEDYSNNNFRKNGGLELLEKTMQILSPDGENYSLGDTTRLSAEDSRDIPTIRMPYSGNVGVPIIHASSAIKRILSFAYMLVWAWQEHLAVCRLRGTEPTRRITFLVDEVEAHLHPRWQRTILRSLMTAIRSLPGSPEVKTIMTTHSPLVMASCEDEFSAESDRWFDLDYARANGNVLLTPREFENMGTAEAWLTSNAFDLASARSLASEQLIREASELLAAASATPEQLDEMERKLAVKLNVHDPYWPRWKWLADRRRNTGLS